MEKHIEEELEEVLGKEAFEEIKEEIKDLKGNIKKKIIIKRKGSDDGEPGVHVHKIHKHFEDKAFHDHKHFDHRRPKEYKKPHKTQKTKLFTNKEEMVEFVNQKGEEGHQIDIFKIEEGLYKVVVVLRRR